MPLSRDQGAVADLAKDLGEGGPVLQVLITDGVGVVAGEELGAGGVALGGVVELGEAQAVFRELIEVGSFDLSAKAADVGVAHVIDHDDDEVWSVRNGGAMSGEQRAESKEE